MKERFNDFKQVLLNLTDLSGTDTAAWRAWINDWDNYVVKGGVRPPGTPPHP